MRLIMALGRFRMDLEMALLSSTDEHEEHETHEVESTLSRPVVGFVPEIDEDDED